jgi:hypothetical protein
MGRDVLRPPGASYATCGRSDAVRHTPKGYSYAYARAFLEAVGEQGRRYYAIPELVIDTFYPPLYALSRGLALWWLTMPGRSREGPVPLKSALRARRSADPHGGARFV